MIDWMNKWLTGSMGRVSVGQMGSLGGFRVDV